MHVLIDDPQRLLGGKAPFCKQRESSEYVQTASKILTELAPNTHYEGLYTSSGSIIITNLAVANFDFRGKGGRVLRRREARSGPLAPRCEQVAHLWETTLSKTPPCPPQGCVTVVV